MSRLPATALWLAILSVAAVMPGTLDRWVLPKLAVLAIAALIAVWVVPKGRLPRWALLILGGGTVILIIAAIAGATPIAALLGVWPRFEGVIAGFGYLLALWIGARLARGISLAAPMATLALLVGAVSIAEALGARPFTSDLARPGSLLGNATDQGAVGAACAIVLLLAVWRAGLTHALILPGLGLLAGVATVVLSGSRAALVGLVLGIVVVAISVAVRERSRVPAIAGGLAFVAVAAIAVVSPSLGPRLLGVTPLSGETVSDRLLIWSETLHLLAAHPIAGVGASGFVDAIGTQHDSTWYEVVGQDSILDSPHNVVLQLAVTGGPLLVGLAAIFAALTVRAIVTARPDRLQTSDHVISATAAILALFVTLLTHVTSPSTVVLAMLLLGSVIAVDHLPPARRVAPTIVIGAWAALVAITLAGEAALWRGVEGDVAAFDIATALRPWDPHTTLIAAESLSARVAAGESGLAPTALEWARRAHAQNPASVPAGKALVTAALAQRDLGLAAATAEQLIESYPTQPWLTARLGAIRLLQGDREAAERLLLRATELDPSTADPWLTLAFLYDQAGETEKAQAATSRAAELSR